MQVGTFVAAWRSLRLSDEDLRSLENELLDNPTAGDVMGGCGGLRKLRFAPPSQHRGKRGETRVVYGYFPVHGHAYLILIYPKNEQDNLTAAQKKQFRELMREIAEYLEEYQ